MESLWQLIWAFLGSVGFALLFGVRAGLIVPASFGGLMCWGIYLICLNRLDFGIFMASFAAAAFTELYAEGMARYLKVPATVLFVPAIVPLIPGSNLYYTMSSTVRQDWEAAGAYGISTLQYALGIALGMSVVCAMFEIYARIFHDSYNFK